MNIADTLVSWYLRNRRELPWRETRNPYLVWLSEVILQQTRVSQGLAYYLRFTERFPDVKSLAAASEEDILRVWQGLGYYSRARNLHATAKEIAGKYNGVFPDSYEGLIALPGIGPYTAAAIASFCFGEKQAVVDGNVIRVLSRLFGVSEPVDGNIGKKAIRQLADDLIPDHDPATYNQAVMEFGALWCTPRQPRCTECPFSGNCMALASGDPVQFPVKGRKTGVRDVWYYYVFLDHGGRTWVRKRSHNGIWKGLHDFPCVESDVPLNSGILRRRIKDELGLDLSADVFETPEELEHVLSHRRIHAVFFRVSKKVMWENRPSEYREIPRDSLDEIGISRLIDRYLLG